MAFSVDRQNTVDALLDTAATTIVESIHDNLINDLRDRLGHTVTKLVVGYPVLKTVEIVTVTRIFGGGGGGGSVNPPSGAVNFSFNDAAQRFVLG